MFAVVDEGEREIEGGGGGGGVGGEAMRVFAYYHSTVAGLFSHGSNCMFTSMYI